MTRRRSLSLAVVALFVGSVAGVTFAQAADDGPQPPVVSDGDDVARAVATATNAEAVFLPFAEPCRLWDDRGGSGPIAQDTTRVYTTQDPLNAQGGSSAGCDIPSEATAVQLSLSTLGDSPTAAGFLRVGAGDDLDPKATLLQFLRGQGTSVTSTVPLDDDGRLAVRARGGSTGTVGDGLGFYVPQSHAIVFGGGDVVNGSNVPGFTTAPDPLLNVRDDTGEYTVPFTSSHNSQCTPTVSAFGTGIAASIITVDRNAFTAAIEVRTMLDGTSTPVNGAFSVTYHC